MKALSPERQAYAAKVLEQIAVSGEGIYRFTEAERRLVREGIADLDAGRVVDAGEMEMFWSRNQT